MKFVEAFNTLGYEVPNPRQDWSAEKNDGVCITFWKVEVIWAPPPPRFDGWALWSHGNHEWMNGPGHQKRRRHLKRAVDEFGGWVDAITLSGTPGKGYETASIWDPAKRANHRWRILELDNATGIFSAAAERQE